MKLAIAAAALALLSGCAKRPDAIVPASIPVSAYSNRSCAELSADLAQERARLAALSDQQNSAATGDAVGVFWLGVPAASVFGGNQEGNVAVSKGKVEAMELAASSKRCPR